MAYPESAVEDPFDAVASFNHRRRARCVLFLYFLPRIKSEHLCRRQYPGRKGAKSDLDRHVRLHPSSNVLRRPISIHRNAACARIMVGATFASLVYTDTRCSYSERRESACTGLTRLCRIYE